MRILVLDVETVQPGWEPTPEQSFAPIALHLPVAICWVVLDATQPPGVWAHVFCGEAGGRWEANALASLAQDMRLSDVLVTYNGRGFDMPLLQLRAIACSVAWGHWQRQRNRYPNYKTPLYHYDLLDQLSDYGAARSLGSLAQVCAALSIDEVKTDLDGASVKDTYARGELARIGTYCLEDVGVTARVFLRAAPLLWPRLLDAEDAHRLAATVREQLIAGENP